MITWYVEITDWAPEVYRTDKYLETIIDTATPFMNHFCTRLGEIKDWKLEDANSIFEELVDELPIMKSDTINGDFRIRYNSWVYIKLTDTIKQIYRESKLNNLLYDRL